MATPLAESFRTPGYGGEANMIRVGSTAGSHRPLSVRRILLTSCAVVVAAGMMLLGAPVGGPKPARAQFSFGGFHISIGGRGWRRGRHSRSARHHRRHRNDDDATPEPENAGVSHSTPASAPAPDSGRPTVRPTSAPDTSTPSGRPELHGPDLEPSK
jgi:hypothetical protein